MLGEGAGLCWTVGCSMHAESLDEGTASAVDDRKWEGMSWRVRLRLRAVLVVHIVVDDDSRSSGVVVGWVDDVDIYESNPGGVSCVSCTR